MTDPSPPQRTKRIVRDSFDDKDMVGPNMASNILQQFQQTYQSQQMSPPQQPYSPQQPYQPQQPYPPQQPYQPPVFYPQFQPLQQLMQPDRKRGLIKKLFWIGLLYIIACLVLFGFSVETAGWAVITGLIGSIIAFGIWMWLGYIWYKI